MPVCYDCLKEIPKRTKPIKLSKFFEVQLCKICKAKRDK